MNAHIIENNTPQSEGEALESLLNLMGSFGGGDTEEFQQVKEIIKENGITADQLWGLMTENAIDEIISRRTIDVAIQFLTDTAKAPEYNNITDGCADIYSDEDIVIEPGQTYPVSTGIAMAIPNGFVVHVYARSGLSMKTGLRLANAVGVIDAGYRDELKVLLWNTGTEAFHVKKGMRIAQMDIKESPMVEFFEVENVKNIPGDRMGGFGSSGLFELLSTADPEGLEILAQEMINSNGEI
jgi:dUTP pyrophosphatase